MKNRFFIGLLPFFCFTLILFISIPSMANEPLKGIQLALSGTAFEAEPALDAETTKVKKTESKESGQESPFEKQTESKNLNQESSKNEQKESISSSQDSKQRSVEQEINELRQEFRKFAVKMKPGRNWKFLKRKKARR